MEKYLLVALQTIQLWFSAKIDRLAFYTRNFPLLLYRNLTKIVSVILLVLLYNLKINWVHLIGFKNKENEKLIEELSVHAMFALILFIFLQKKISELVGLGIGSKDKFYADDFFYKIRQSSFRVRILETFTEVILEKGNKEKLIRSIQHFLINAKRRKSKPLIQILLLDPNSDYAELRIKQLIKTEYEDFVAINEERSRWLGYLKDWEEIKSDIERFSSQKISRPVDFQIFIYDTTPQYSIYSCDEFAYIGPYIEGVKTTQMEQAIVNLEKPINREYMQIFEDLLNIHSEYTNSPTRKLDDYLRFPYNVKNIGAVKTFVSLRRMTDEDEIERLLTNQLDPMKLTTEELLGLVLYLEQNHFVKTTDAVHYNIFGTGGDKKKTINISTMAAILASHYKGDHIVINKYGTLEVTCKVGSETFYNRLTSELRQRNNSSKYFKFNSKNGSKYVHLSTFGYDYTDQIRNVRNRIWRNNKSLDIFKIIFPISNLSGNSGQVNGVSNLEYWNFYKKIYERLNKRGIIVHNEGGSDELLEGKNKISIHLNNGLVVEKEFVLKKTKNAEEVRKYWEYYSESTIQGHVDQFLKFFEQPDHIKWTMAYNVALIVRLQIDDEIDILAKRVFEWFKSVKVDHIL